MLGLGSINLVAITVIKKICHSLISPYGHLCITNSSFGPRNTKNHTFPTSITDTSIKRTLGCVPLVSVLKRFDCIYIGSV